MFLVLIEVEMETTAHWRRTVYNNKGICTVR